MPFGLCNALATFQCFMGKVLQGLQSQILALYVDNVFVFSRMEEEHIRCLAQVLGCLCQVGLKLKPRKCQFLQKQVHRLPVGQRCAVDISQAAIGHNAVQCAKVVGRVLAVVL